jgi:Protein of unknown function (DUF3347)
MKCRAKFSGIHSIVSTLKFKKMKTVISILFVAATITFVSCGNNNSNNSKESSESKKDTSSQVTSTANNESKSNSAINDVVSDYLNLKNALTNDNGNEAASAAKEMGNALAKVDGSTLTPEQKKVYNDVRDDLKEHAEHIGSNGSDIAHQREHFDMMSQDMIDLTKAVGTSKTLYKDFCPMYNNKKGAFWLSETKEIKNPYYGNEMPKCGEVKEEIKAKG